MTSKTPARMGATADGGDPVPEARQSNVTEHVQALPSNVDGEVGLHHLHLTAFMHSKRRRACVSLLRALVLLLLRVAPATDEVW